MISSMSSINGFTSFPGITLPSRVSRSQYDDSRASLAAIAIFERKSARLWAACASSLACEIVLAARSDVALPVGCLQISFTSKRIALIKTGFIVNQFEWQTSGCGIHAAGLVQSQPLPQISRAAGVHHPVRFRDQNIDVGHISQAELEPILVPARHNWDARSYSRCSRIALHRSITRKANA